MKILAIETSCDETAIALLEVSGEPGDPNIKILANALYSQTHLHKEYGGVYPTLAKREHERNLPLLLEQIMNEVTSTNPEINVARDIDFIAVTEGPGLEPALWTGITFAQKLSGEWGKPIVPVDHMEGHIWSVLYKTDQNSKFKIPVPAGRQENSKLELPALALLVSGGHTELVYINDFCDYKILGRTRDDAVGEAFDKVARMLGLPYPGGPQISKLANQARNKNGSADPEQTIDISFPRPMINSKDFDFSYSGLKTAVLYYIRKNPPRSEVESRVIALEFENSAIEVLVTKTQKALETYPEIKSLIVAGGVSANQFLRSETKRMLANFPQTELHLPLNELATDNAVMIGIAGYIRNYVRPDMGGENLRARGNLSL